MMNENVNEAVPPIILDTFAAACGMSPYQIAADRAFSRRMNAVQWSRRPSLSARHFAIRIDRCADDSVQYVSELPRPSRGAGRASLCLAFGF